MRNVTALKPYPIFRLTIPLVAGIFLSDAVFHGTLPVDGFRIAICVLLVGIFVMVKRQKYTFRWLFGSMAFFVPFLPGGFVGTA
ncbi:MAG: hypothetical protein LUI85_07870 [Bacteroides sp.]|nr:hypothetical protein [Bacteroides sp.]